MRTTLDLEPHLMKKIRHKATEEGKTLKEVINRALESGLSGAAASNKRVRYKLPGYRLGQPGTSLSKALALAEHLEDEGVLSKLELRK